MILKLKAWWRRKHRGYVIIYDRVSLLDEPFNEPMEEYYGYFADPNEARRIWDDYTSCNQQNFTNVKLCRIVEDWNEDLD